MILLALVSTLIPQPQPADAQSADIVVIAKRAEAGRVALRQDRKTGRQSCKVTRSSGDPEIDRRVCGVVLACTPANATAKDRDEVMLCYRPRMREMVVELAAERARLRQ